MVYGKNEKVSPRIIHTNAQLNIQLSHHRLTEIPKSFFFFFFKISKKTKKQRGI